MPEYRGVNLKDVPVESNLFKGIKFSKCLCDTCGVMAPDTSTASVVASDPKSRTGEKDKGEMLKL